MLYIFFFLKIETRVEIEFEFHRLVCILYTVWLLRKRWKENKEQV